MTTMSQRRRPRWVGVAVVVGLLAGSVGCAGPDEPVALVTVAAPPASVRATPPAPPTPAAPAPEPVVAAPAPDPAPAAADPVAAAEDRVLVLANEARAEAGLAPLTRSPDLDPVARAWSMHLATGGLDLAHNPDYSTQIPPGWSQSAENVGWMSPSGMSAEDVAAQIHASWMASPGHRANLLNPAFTHIGIGVVDSPENGWYLTQNFAAY